MADLIDLILFYSREDVLEAKVFKEKVEKESGATLKGLHYNHLSPERYYLKSFKNVIEMGLQYCFFVTDHFLHDLLMEF